jgi:hypothetical protein
MKTDHALKYLVDKICRSVIVNIATTLEYEFIPGKFNTYIIGKMHSYTPMFLKLWSADHK